MRTYLTGAPAGNERLFAVRAGRFIAKGAPQITWWSRHPQYMDGATNDPYGGRWGDSDDHITLIPERMLHLCPWGADANKRIKRIDSLEEADAHIMACLKTPPYPLTIWCWVYIATSFSIERG